MEYKNTYNINILLNEQEFDIIPSNFSFVQKDSIFQLYPTAYIKYNDIQALLSEYLAFVNGTKVTIDYGTIENSYSCDYVVVKNSIPDQYSTNSLGGMSEISLLHYFSFNQSKKSFAYKDEISNIISKLTSYFKKKIIEKTENKGIWYQSLITDADFMEHYLLPFAYSSTSSDTPFFLFIDSNNVFHFQSYHSLFTQKSVIELRMYEKGTPSSLGKDAIQAIYPYQSNLLEIRNTLNPYFFNFNNNASYTIFNDTIKKHLYGNKKIPIIFDTNNVYTDVVNLYSEDIEDVNTKNNNNGLKLFHKRNIFVNDKLIIALNLNKDLCAGKKVTVSIPSFGDKENKELSLRYSGDYIIESSYHSWNSAMGNTILVVSRQGSVFHNSYRNVKNIITA